MGGRGTLWVLVDARVRPRSGYYGSEMLSLAPRATCRDSLLARYLERYKREMRTDMQRALTHAYLGPR